MKNYNETGMALEYLYEKRNILVTLIKNHTNPGCMKDFETLIDQYLLVCDAIQKTLREVDNVF